MAITWIIEFDWDNDDSFVHDESARVVGLSWERGRESQFDSFMAGKAVLTLENNDRRFDPWYTSSPIYPNVMPARKVKIRATYDGTTYDIFLGKIEDIEPTGHIGNRRVTITAYDGMRDLNAADAPATLQEGIRTDEGITAVLDAIDWPAGATWRDLDTGATTLAYWWSPGGEKASKLLEQLASVENGALFVSAAGKVKFVNRTNWGTSAIAGTLDEDNISDLMLDNPWESVRNIINIRCYPVQLASSADLWQLKDDSVYVAAGESVELWAEYRDSNGNAAAAKNVISPVATTDYTANTVQGGGGADMTASMSVTANIYSTWCKLTVSNTHASTGFYITLLKVRGQAIEATQTTIRRENTTSQNTYGKRTFNIEAPWTQDINSAIDMATALREFYADPQANVTVQLDNLFPDLLKYEVGDRITITIDSYSISEAMRLGKMAVQTGRTMQDVKGTFYLEPADSTVYWLLEDAIYGLLGSTTRLGY